MDPRKQRTTDALLRAAQEIFNDRPAEEVTVEEIADRAGVSYATIYNNFGSKAGLHAAVIERALDVNWQFTDLAFGPGTNPVDQMYAAAEQYLQFYLQYPEYFRMLAYPTDPGRYPAGKTLSQRMAREINEQNNRIVDAIRSGIEAGIARPVDPTKVATVLWATWNGIISLGWRPDELRCSETELRSLLQTATDVIANGLLLRPIEEAENT
jgi:TetR/AcrR family transcriptional regulator